MGKFLIFLMVVFVLSIIGMVLVWIWSHIYRSIERKDASFEIEKETYKKIKDKVMEEKE